ncbi:MAG: hypothetical protein ACRD9S_22080 [Pyrinomonadaceae bacterium]
MKSCKKLMEDPARFDLTTAYNFVNNLYAGKRNSMPSKKKTVSTKSTRRRVLEQPKRGKASTSFSSKGKRVKANGVRYERPRTIPGETAEERKKRHAEMEALTLRAFQMAYDNHHPRHSS